MRTFFLAVLTGSLAACGGGGGGGGPSGLTVVLPGNAALDGVVRSSGDVFVDSLEIVMGDIDFADPMMMMPAAVGERGFWTFDMDAIPAGATIVSATFTVVPYYTEGAPFTDGHGGVILDHLDYGSTLEFADFDALALSTDIGTLCSADTPDPKSLDVSAAVQADLDAGRPHSQFRSRFSAIDTDADGIADRTAFHSADSPTLRPTLTVVYTP